MEALAGLASGFAIAFTPTNLVWSLVGVTLGTFIGVLPGIGPALTIALLLPVTYKIDPTAAFIVFGGIYYGAMYGSSTTSILINTPGETGSIVTTLDGHQMARRGRGAAALATAAIGSFVAGVIGTFLLALLAPEVVKLALLFGPAEYFALMCVAFVAISSMLGSSVRRGLVALFLGLALGLVGIDQQSGQARYAFGLLELLDGIGVVVVAVGLFALGEALYFASRRDLRQESMAPLKGSLAMTAEEWRRSWKPWLRGTAIGFPLGALPAGGTELPTFLSYRVERDLSPRKEEFGRGAIEGVAGPEAANNAAVAGVLVPLLTFGLPTSATAAIMLAAFQQYGINPGPLLFANNAALVWGLIASLFIGNAMLLVLNLPMAGLWVRLLHIPRPWLQGGIVLFAVLGVFGASRAIADIAILAGVGLLGFVLKRLDYPLAPVVVGLILGPMAEVQFRRALQIAQGDWWVFVEKPIAAALFALAAILLVLPSLIRFYAKRSPR
ncbi:MAG: tripartite tricarboxylate transporter permease [Rhodospirillales bacterium]|nr:tripartite tricarboxylate transporter permease [Rhodospirillales bacterium]